MTLIGFDTSLAQTSACLLRDDGATFCTPPPESTRLFQPARHSQELLPELERLVSESGTSWSDIGSIAVGVGPGTFTGLRIGIATARALAQALDLGLRPVSSLEALAAALASEVAVEPERPLLSLIDARRRQVFAALYRRRDGDGAGPPERVARSPVEQLWEPSVFDPDGLLARLTQLDPQPVCAGDWAIKSRTQLEGAGALVPPSESGLHAVSGLHLCRLATCVEPVAREVVYPVYLRLPDAEINKRRALGQLDDGEDL